MEPSPTTTMWPFRKKAAKKKSLMPKKVIVGLIIGGAIGSIVGKKLLEKHDKDDEDSEKE